MKDIKNQKILYLIFLFILLTISLKAEDINDLYKKGEEAKKNKKYKEAIEFYSEAIKLDNKWSNLYTGRGFAYKELNLYDEAIKDFTKAIELSPDWSSPYYDRGITYLNKKMDDEAIKDFTKAIELSPDWSSPYNYRGKIHINKKMYDKAIEDFTKAIKLAPKWSDSYYNRGLIYQNLEKHNSAIEDFTKAIKYSPEWRSIYFGRGCSYYCESMFKEALADFKKAINLDNNDGYAYFFQFIISKKISDTQFNNSYKNLINKKKYFKEKDWEFTIAEFITDNINVNEILLKAGNDNEKLCEAYCYIGYKFLFNGDKTNAKSYFEKCIKTEVDYYFEYKFSNNELTRL